MKPRNPALASITGCLAMILLADYARADLVAHWKLDEISGTTAADSAGGDNTGTLNNGPSWVTGIIGGGLDFDGTDDFLNAPLTGIPIGTGSRTVALWFNADNVSTQGAKLFAYGDGSGISGQGGADPDPEGDAFTFTIEDGGLIYFRYSGGNNRYNLAGNTNLSTDTWYHLAAVLPDGATNSDQVLVYLNGTLANTTVIGAVKPLFTDPTAAAPDFYLGKDSTSAPCFDGTLDDVQVYDSALSATEIAALYNDPGSVISGGSSPAITVFASAGGNMWDLTLAGEPIANYELRSSTTLKFNPGTLVINLGKADPEDPGIIGGDNDSVITTDGDGNAKVRLSLTGTPSDFVRAVSLP